MPIQVGERLPEVPLTIATSDGPKPTTTSEYFAGNNRRRTFIRRSGCFHPDLFGASFAVLCRQGADP